MNRKEYQSLRKKLESARNEVIATAEAEYEQGLEALDRLWDVAGDGESKRGPGRPRKKTTRSRRAATGRRKSTRRAKKTSTKRDGRRGRAGGTVIAAMRSAIAKQRGQFTVADVKSGMPDKMVKVTKPAVFSTTMKRLEHLGELKVVKRGKGRRATTYKKGG